VREFPELFGNEDSEPGHVLNDESNTVSDTEIDPHDVDADICEGNETYESDGLHVETQSDDQSWSDDSESDCEDED
jgi:hypothetical protein